VKHPAFFLSLLSFNPSVFIRAIRGLFFLPRITRIITDYLFVSNLCCFWIITDVIRVHPCYPWSFFYLTDNVVPVVPVVFLFIDHGSLGLSRIIYSCLTSVVFGLSQMLSVSIRAIRGLFLFNR